MTIPLTIENIPAAIALTVSLALLFVSVGYWIGTVKTIKEFIDV